MKERKQLVIYHFVHPVGLFIYALFLYSYYGYCYEGLSTSLLDCLILFGSLMGIVAWMLIGFILAKRDKAVPFFHMNKKLWMKIGSVIMICMTCFYGYQIIGLWMNRTLGIHVNLVNETKTLIGQISYELQNEDHQIYRMNLYEHTIRDGELADLLEKLKNVMTDGDLDVESFSVDCDQDGRLCYLDMKGRLDDSKIYHVIYNQKYNCLDITCFKTQNDYQHDSKLSELIRVLRMDHFDFVLQKKKDFSVVWYGEQELEKNGNAFYYNQYGQEGSYEEASVNEMGLKLVVCLVDGRTYEYFYVEKFMESEEEQAFTLEDTDDACYAQVDDLIYQLKVTDAALGSRFYSLFQSYDGGHTWEVVNNDPLSLETGVAVGMMFMDQRHGFITFTHAERMVSHIYYTHDAGQHFTLAEFPEMYEYAFLDIPYLEKGVLCVHAYASFDSRNKFDVYTSDDLGKTWKKRER